MDTLDSTIADTSDRLKAAVSELAGLQTLLLSDNLDPRILADFRDAVNRVRNTAWAAQQYAEVKVTGNNSTDILSIVAGERIRAAFQLCQAIESDLGSTDIRMQAGHLIELSAATKSLHEKLKDIVKDLES